MLKNYIKIAFRNLFRKKLYSFLNITGLAIGLACSILLLFYIQDELSFDRFHEKGDRLYRLESDLSTSDRTYEARLPGIHRHPEPEALGKCRPVSIHPGGPGRTSELPALRIARSAAAAVGGV